MTLPVSPGSPARRQTPALGPRPGEAAVLGRAHCLPSARRAASQGHPTGLPPPVSPSRLSRSVAAEPRAGVPAL